MTELKLLSEELETKDADGNLDLPFREIGVSGLRQTFGRIQEEVLRELEGPRAIRAYKKMSLNEPMIAASDLIIRLLIRQVDWFASATGQTEQEIDDRDFLEQNMHDMSHTWDDFIDDDVSMTLYGFSISEKVYKIRGEFDEETDQINSKYNDGRVGWKKFAFRSQDSLDRWDFEEETGGIKGFWQRDPNTSKIHYIPIGKVLLFRTTKRKNNPQGLSTYRGAYKPYRMKEEMIIQEAMIAEMDATGTPVIWAPESYFDTSKATSTQTKLLQRLFKYVTHFGKADSERGLVMPLGFDKQGNPKFKIELLTTPGRRTIDLRKVIESYNMEMLAVALTDFILLGHQQVGSFSLSSDKTNLLSVALGAYLKNIKQVINRWAVPELFELNGMRRQAYPTVEHGDIETLDLNQVVESITKLFAAGFPVADPEKIANTITERLGLSGANG